jgi:outer membrane protein OmpA-like peptidoglycan-associated protein
LAVVVLAMALLAPTAATAQVSDDLNLATQRFLPSPHAYDLQTVMTSHVRDNFDFLVGLYLNWEADTMIFEDAAGELDKVLTGRLTSDIVASMSFLRYFSIGLDFPLYLYNMGASPNGAFAPGSGGAIDRGDVEGFSWGDLRLSAKVRFLDAVESMFGIAVAVDVTVPTGKKDAFATDDGVTVTPRLIADLNIEGYKVALNIGYKYRPDYSIRWLDVSPEFFIALGVGIPIIEHNLDILAELETTAKTAAFFSDQNTDYLEGRVGARYISDKGLGVSLMAGAGFLTAYGSPLYRLSASFFYAPRDISRDLDGDGIADDVDKCPTEPEDFDGFQDADGCPDPDNDKDGILDVNDACPNEPEDFDGFQDEDGCPDPDNDGDGILDVDDQCPNDPEDFDGFQDADGCPDPDNDGDGILDVNDQCPNEPEDFDGCQDEDGCPEPGNVCVTETEIKILQAVFFQTNRATIKPESFPILDEVAQVLQQHPEILKIEIQGHTDDRGNDRYNMRLSDARAKSVMAYLAKAGVDKKRLTAKGYGETMPIDTNETEDGRARNRRVVFQILEKAPAGTEIRTIDP